MTRPIEAPNNTVRATNIRVLSHMMTGCVVWYDVELRSTARAGKRIPVYNPELDYIVFEGLVNVDVFPKYFKDYSLNLSYYDPTTFNIAPLPDEYKDIVKFSRAKCYALTIFSNLVDRAMERNGVFNNPLLDPHIRDEDIVNIYQKRLNIDKISAEKLLQFNKEEYAINIRNIRNIQIDGEMAIVNATNIEQILSEFLKASGEIGAGEAKTEMITRLL